MQTKQLYNLNHNPHPVLFQTSPSVLEVCLHYQSRKALKTIFLKFEKFFLLNNFLFSICLPFF